METLETNQTPKVELSKAEYESLIEQIEDLEDTIAFIQFEQTQGETVPHELIQRRNAGDHPLTIYREYRGLSQRALASKAGVNHVQIGDIENRGKTGSVATLLKLARSLDVPLENIVVA